MPPRLSDAARRDIDETDRRLHNPRHGDVNLMDTFGQTRLLLISLEN